jgi:putative Mn2+ efflux pump MntP
MAFLTLVLTALGLAADCFAVAVSGSIALRAPTRLQVVRTAFAFGFAQFLMPLLGWVAGREFVDVVAGYDHWVALGLLGAVGLHMLRESASGQEHSEASGDITRGIRLIVLAIATSIDALAVGLTFAFLQVDIVLASSVIGATAFAITTAGFSVGTRLGVLAGKRAQLVGGLILIAIGVKTVLEHTLF